MVGSSGDGAGFGGSDRAGFSQSHGSTFCGVAESGIEVDALGGAADEIDHVSARAHDQTPKRLQDRRRSWAPAASRTRNTTARPAMAVPN